MTRVLRRTFRALIVASSVILLEAAISEVKVRLNNYRAENARNGGAMVSIVTKSGSKDDRRHRLFSQSP